VYSAQYKSTDRSVNEFFAFGQKSAVGACSLSFSESGANRQVSRCRMYREGGFTLCQQAGRSI
jgi:hypothetical protein